MHGKERPVDARRPLQLPSRRFSPYKVPRAFIIPLSLFEGHTHTGGESPDSLRTRFRAPSVAFIIPLSLFEGHTHTGGEWPDDAQQRQTAS